MAAEPKFKCVLRGQQYHRKKTEFKKMLKSYGLNYGGSWEFPYWGGENEYVRAEFVRKCDPDTGVDCTESATLALFIRKDKKPTKFSTEFRKWCKKAEKEDPYGIIVPKKKEASPKKLIEAYADDTHPNIDWADPNELPTAMSRTEAWREDVKRKAIELLGEDKGEVWYQEWRESPRSSARRR